MPIVLDHMTIPVRDRDEAVAFYTRVFGGEKGAVRGRIAGLWVTKLLELQFRAMDNVESLHYAFRLEPAEFDEALERITAIAIPYGRSRDELNGELLVSDGNKSAFFSDPNGHSLELITSS
jgi:catechol 2,3-dioxygenase-like lactoylglutathione lyase family enzyme